MNAEQAVQVFGGAGIVTLPMSCIVAFLRRPRATITRSEYIKVNIVALLPLLGDCNVQHRLIHLRLPSQEATSIGKRAKEVRELAVALHQEEKSGTKTWSWRRNVKKLQQVLKKPCRYPCI